MIKLKTFAILALLALHLCLTTTAQGIVAINSLQLSSDSIVRLFHAWITDSNLYLNGRVNTFRYPGARGNPFYGDGNWIKGSYSRDGLVFNNLNLRYDILNDGLLCIHYEASGPVVIELNKILVSSFVLNGHTFINFDLFKPDLKAEGGYYEELASGQASMYIKWKKQVTTPTANHPGEYYSQKFRYMLLHDKFYRITSRKSVLGVLADRSGEIKSYLRQHRISVKHANDRELAGVVIFYNSLF
jgi:hypothetical protein